MHQSVQVIAEILADHGMRWHRQGVWFQPTAADIQSVLEKAQSVLKDAEDLTEYDQAGILVRKEQGDLNIYINIGKI